MRRLVQHDLDWEYLLAMAERHCLIPLFYYHLNAACSSAVPPQAMSQLRVASHENTLSGLFLTGELLKLLDFLRAHGIHAIPFKGPTLAVCAYGDVGLRQFSDLDLFVHKQDFARVKELLADRGFQPEAELTKAQEAALLRYGCGYNFGNENGVWLDVHWDFVAPYFSFELDVEQLWKRAEPITIGGQQLLTFSPGDLLLILCLHGYTHFWDRLGWICDIASLIDRRKEIDWELVLENAARLGSRRILSLGLFLAAELLEATIPQDVWKTVQADPVVRKFAEQVVQQLFVERIAPPGIFDGALLNLRMRERKRDRLKSGLRLVVTPRVYDWMFLTLPGWLHFLYYPLRSLRLAGKYGARLLTRSDGG